jgi:hypothetical protein
MKIKYLSLLVLLFPLSVLAQINDYGVWTTIGADKDVGKWNFATEAELRTNDNSTEVNRWSMKLEASYSILKQLKVGAGYEFIYFHDLKYWDFQPRNRFYFNVQGKYKFANFIFTLRERAQVTAKDESDRIKSNGKIDTYRVNPAWVWRNRLKLAYNIPHFPVTPSFSFETFYSLNDPDGNDFNDLRYTLAFTYNLTKHHELELYGLIDREINVNNRVQTYVLGLSYHYSF